MTGRTLSGGVIIIIFFLTKCKFQQTCNLKL